MHLYHDVMIARVHELHQFVYMLLVLKTIEKDKRWIKKNVPNEYFGLALDNNNNNNNNNFT
jgi:hypothetical protein